MRITEATAQPQPSFAIDTDAFKAQNPEISAEAQAFIERVHQISNEMASSVRLTPKDADTVERLRVERDRPYQVLRQLVGYSQAVVQENQVSLSYLAAIDWVALYFSLKVRDKIVQEAQFFQKKGVSNEEVSRFIKLLEAAYTPWLSLNRLGISFMDLVKQKKVSLAEVAKYVFGSTEGETWESTNYPAEYAQKFPTVQQSAFIADVSFNRTVTTALTLSDDTDYVRQVLNMFSPATRVSEIAAVIDPPLQYLKKLKKQMIGAMLAETPEGAEIRKLLSASGLLASVDSMSWESLTVRLGQVMADEIQSLYRKSLEMAEVSTDPTDKVFFEALAKRTRSEIQLLTTDRLYLGEIIDNFTVKEAERSPQTELETAIIGEDEFVDVCREFVKVVGNITRRKSWLFAMFTQRVSDTGFIFPVGAAVSLGVKRAEFTFLFKDDSARGQEFTARALENSEEAEELKNIFGATPIRFAVDLKTGQISWSILEPQNHSVELQEFYWFLIFNSESLLLSVLQSEKVAATIQYALRGHKTHTQLPTEPTVKGPKREKVSRDSLEGAAQRVPLLDAQSLKVPTDFTQQGSGMLASLDRTQTNENTRQGLIRKLIFSDEELEAAFKRGSVHDAGIRSLLLPQVLKVVEEPALFALDDVVSQRTPAGEKIYRYRLNADYRLLVTFDAEQSEKGVAKYRLYKIGRRDEIYN